MDYKQSQQLKDMIYRSGDAFLPKQMREYLEQYWVGNYYSLYYITNWTLVHFWSGFVLAVILKFLLHSHNVYLLTFQIHLLWELWQIIIGMTPWMTLRGIIDIANDTLFYMVGVWLGVHISYRIYEMLRRATIIVLPIPP
jgi:CDP-diglyceride synthetase